MLKTCGNSTCRSLELIVKDCLANVIFRSNWKKGNGVCSQKKFDKQGLNHYHPLNDIWQNSRKIIV